MNKIKKRKQDERACFFFFYLVYPVNPVYFF